MASIAMNHSINVRIFNFQRFMIWLDFFLWIPEETSASFILDLILFGFYIKLALLNNHWTKRRLLNAAFNFSVYQYRKIAFWTLNWLISGSCSLF
jgi:hypothetical protein